MSEVEAETHFQRGLKALDEGRSLSALPCFEKAYEMGKKPAYSSYFGFCIAKERGQVQKGTLLCREALEKEPENGVHYLNLGRVLLVAGNKEEALGTFRKGLGHGPNESIMCLLDSIGRRSRPPIPYLDRDNPINKYLGIVLGKLGLR
ncbi:MAG: hypothetical protein EHM36_04235 [Deltaproteobacteria bacterium]|nr:MAG: hypothetical protein EHM36_04235 [Deltaproteobacteria bacterium]